MRDRTRMASCYLLCSVYNVREEPLEEGQVKDE